MYFFFFEGSVFTFQFLNDKIHSYVKKQARKGFRTASAMFVIIFLKFFGLFFGFLWNFFLGIFLEDFFLMDFHGENFLGGFFWEDFFGRIFWEDFFMRISLWVFFCEEFFVRTFGRNSTKSYLNIKIIKDCFEMNVPL